MDSFCSSEDDRYFASTIISMEINGLDNSQDLASLLDYSVMEAVTEEEMEQHDRPNDRRMIKSILKVARWLDGLRQGYEADNECDDYDDNDDDNERTETATETGSIDYESESDSKPLYMNLPSTSSSQLSSSPDSNKRKALENIFGRRKDAKLSSD